MESLHRHSSLLGEFDRSGNHLLADVTELHRNEDARELGLGEAAMLVGRHDSLEQALPARPAHDDVHDEADGEPGRPGEARALVRADCDQPDREREEGPDDRRHRHAADCERHAVGAPAVRLAEAQLDHGELCGGEREEHAEAEEAREEEHGMRERGRSDEQPNRDQGRGNDGFRRDERTRPEHPEPAWQLAVLPQRIGQATEAGDGGGRRGQQD